MDFLGLKNLTIIKDCLKIIKHLHKKEIDIRNLELNDSLTFEIFKNGNTTGIFQFSSDGMRSHLKNLKPDKFDDLIAMNALYRPGPMEYIPNFIKRKHGKEEISYDLPEMEEYLSQTYGITVYQEQVMLLSQKLANFTRGEADSLRKGMGKKIKSVIDELKPKFVNGCKENGYDETIVEKIWSDWEKFASYAFNKSHSTCYALIAYQTAYLKAHYPAELMASLLTNHMRDIKDITHYMEECKRMGISVLSPDVNESFYKFAVNQEGEIRFGLGAVKGVGEGAVAAIVAAVISGISAWKSTSLDKLQQEKAELEKKISSLKTEKRILLTQIGAYASIEDYYNNNFTSKIFEPAKQQRYKYKVRKALGIKENLYTAQKVQKEILSLRQDS